MRCELRAMTVALFVGLVAGVAASCGGGGGSEGSAPAGDTGAVPEAGAELTPAQLKNGIGPVTEVDVSGMDEALAERGHNVFSLKCAACHKLTERYVGPELGRVLERRTPAYVMNMILNPEEMVAKHPVARDLLAQLMTPMPNQQLTMDEARAVLEYLRSAQLSGDSTESGK